MIPRTDPSGALLLIGQTEHSRLVGQFAAHWGNACFATPEPFESMARAATFHDFGWLRYETRPLYDATSGATPNFRDVPTDAGKLAEYRWCCDWLLADDPYAGLIVSMHRTGLWRGRYDTIAHPPARRRAQPPEVERFVAEEEARQAALRRQGDEAGIWTNYRLMQVWDLLGLYFACADPVADHIEPVPTSYGGGRDEGVRLRLAPDGARTVALDPFPFDRRPCLVQLGAKRLDEPRYRTRDDFIAAYFGAPTVLLEFRLV